MNREIKFRGKSKFNNQDWVYGNLALIDDTPSILEESMDWEDGSEMSLNNWSYVHEETIGQYTGLKDKNGKEIYEGDILGNGERAVGWVKGGVRGYCYDVVYINHPTGEKRWTLYGTVEHDFPNSIEVIGNIFDNNELLNEERICTTT